MINFKKIALIIQATLFLLGTVFAQYSNADELKVIATIKPIHSILAGLMEGIEQPQLLIDESPYRFKPDATIQTRLAQSDLIVWIGPELEASLQAPLSTLPAKVKVIELLSNPSLKILSKRYDDNRRDPYFWLDTRNALILVDELALALIDVDPVRSHLYKKNRRNVRLLLRKLDRELEYGYRGLQDGVGYLYHDTQQYFEQAYALKTGGELLDTPDAVADAAKLIKLRSQLAEGDFNCLLTEKNMPNRYLDLLVPQNSSQVWELDSLGQQFEAGADLYIKMMEYNSSVIKQCLKVNGGTLERIDSALAEKQAGVSDVGRFIMINHLGEVVTERDMRGKYQLLFFGYTSCPDVCPLSLHTLTSALD
ncbi:MAG: zinc ABC transporter solute-binding protein, partial [Gammaproteobacteria bacterium]|nr:zinc ABC transporter solute-binding protein [Gammaproteobacteria bacterium]